MDVILFTKMLTDKSFYNLKKMQYKYSVDFVEEMLMLLKQMTFKKLHIKDFTGKDLVYIEPLVQIHMSTYKSLYASNNSSFKYGLKAMTEEIYSTLDIENIDSSRNSIRQILNGYAPKDDIEFRISGMKKGLEFISNKENVISEENVFKLYMLAVGDFLEEKDKLSPLNYYRHDSVYVVGGKIEHQGIDYKKLPHFMAELIEFINKDTKMNEVLKAAAIHFYFAYLHPYFDGNGRMARLIHLWYLVQQGYVATLFIPFSNYINKTRSAYYKAFTQVEENYKISGLIDITPFLVYFVTNIYNKIGETKEQTDTINIYQNALLEGKITLKEKDLFQFVLSVYGENDFSTKQLEKDFGNAAYATIRSFVLKFNELDIFSSRKYGNRVRYRVSK